METIDRQAYFKVDDDGQATLTSPVAPYDLRLDIGFVRRSVAGVQLVIAAPNQPYSVEAACGGLRLWLETVGYRVLYLAESFDEYGNDYVTALVTQTFDDSEIVENVYG